MSLKPTSKLVQNKDQGSDSNVGLFISPESRLPVACMWPIRADLDRAFNQCLSCVGRKTWHPLLFLERLEISSGLSFKWVTHCKNYSAGLNFELIWNAIVNLSYFWSCTSNYSQLGITCTNKLMRFSSPNRGPMTQSGKRIKWNIIFLVLSKISQELPEHCSTLC